MEALDILAVSPHPDDAELGCGGGLLLASANGHRTAVVDLTDGERATRGTPERRLAEKARAAERLGLCERFSLKLPDTELRHDPAHRLPLIELIRATRPRVVLAPYWEDRHPDHEVAARLARDACFYAGVAAVGTQKPFRPQRVYFYMIHSHFMPSFVLDVTPVWERKLGVLDAYRSQFITGGADAGPQTALSTPLFLKFHESRAVYFGAMIGVAYGEPYFSTAPVAAVEIPGIATPASPADGPFAYRSF